MGMDAVIMISAQLVEKDIRESVGDDVTVAVETAVRTAFESCLKNTTGMLSNDDQLFRSGVGGLLLYFKDNADMRERIEYEMEMLKVLSAATSGIPVNFGAVLREDIEPLGLLGVFRAVKEADGEDNS